MKIVLTLICIFASFHLSAQDIFTVKTALSKTYKTGDQIIFDLAYTRPVVVTGEPTIHLTIGPVQSTAKYISGTGSRNLIFSYVVEKGINDEDGIELSNTIDLNGGSIKHYSGGLDANLELIVPSLSNVKVDTVSPQIINVVPPVNSNYYTNNILTFEIHFDDIVKVSGIPRIPISIGENIRYADYVSGHRTKKFIFQYTIVESDLDENGIVINSPLDLNEGSLSDMAGNDLIRTFQRPDTSGIKVLGSNPVVVSITPPEDGLYTIGQNLDFSINFNKPVFVKDNPKLKIVSGVHRFAEYVSGNGTNILLFRLPVSGGSTALNGIRISGFDISNGTINDSHNNSLNHNIPLQNLKNVRVDAPSTGIASISVQEPIPTHYKANDNIDFIVEFTEPITVSKYSAKLKVNIGGTIYSAINISGSGTSTHVYRLLVRADYFDMDGISIEGPITLSGSTFSNPGGTAPVLTFSNSHFENVKIDATLPTILSNTVPSPGTYSAGQHFDFDVTYSKNVSVIGDVGIEVFIGTGALDPDYPTVSRLATYHSGNGTNVIKFRYTIEEGLLDSNGIVIAKRYIISNDGDVIDQSGNSGQTLNAGIILTNTNTSQVNVLTVRPVISSVAVTEAGRYQTGQHIDIYVNYSHPVIVNLMPRIPLTVGSQTRYANYVTGGGTNLLTFRYTIQEGDFDENGIEVSPGIDLNEGTITDISMGQIAERSFSSPDTSGLYVDGIDLSIAAITPPADRTYKISEILDFTVHFNSIALISGSPTLRVQIGNIVGNASYVSGSGTSNLLFRYIVQDGDNDSDGISIPTTTLDINGGSITDAFGDDAILTSSGSVYTNVRIDTTPPLLTEVFGPQPGTYIQNSNLDFSVNFDEPVIVSGTPRIRLTVGSTTKYATYVQGSNSTSLLFRYAVSAGDQDLNGIQINSQIDLNNGTIRDIAGLEPINLNFSSPDTSLVNVDGSNLNLVSITPPANGKYNTGSTVNFIANFNRPVFVSGVPRISLTIGSTVVYAQYNSGSGTNALNFSYTVKEGDSDNNGISISSPVALNGGSIKDEMNNNATLTFSPPSMALVKIDGIDLKISSITPPPSGAYRTSQVLNFNVEFNHPAVVIGSPRLQLNIGSTSVLASYYSGSGTSSLVFRYTILSGQFDSDGISITAGNINLNGGTIRDIFGDNADITVVDYNFSEVTVDAQAPTISGMTPPSDGTYLLNDNLDFKIQFSEPVIVTGSPRIRLAIGNSTYYADYFSDSGSDIITFRYKVLAGHNDTNGIAAVSPLVLNGGTIQDSTGNAPTSYTFSAPNMANVLVNSNPASISSFSLPTNATYKTGTDLNFVVNFTRPVDVTGTPKISITVGSITKFADYVSGSGTDALTFRYTVEAGDSDNNGIRLNSPLQLNGGTITTDDGSRNATVTFTSPSTPSILIDGIDLQIESIASSQSGTFRSGTVLSFNVKFNYPATVSGTPRLPLSIGSSTVYANYSSGTGTTSHTYRFTITAGLDDSDGITAVGPINLNGGMIRDAFLDQANLNFANTEFPEIKIDSIVPLISSVEPPAEKTYGLGESVDFQVKFSENVTITGTPRLSLVVGSYTRYSVYVSGSGTDTATFRYTVLANDVDTNGIALNSSLSLNGGTIRDVGLNNLTSYNFTVPNVSGILIDSIIPKISSISAPPSGTYSVGQSLDFLINFTEEVSVSGNPQLMLDVGGVTIPALYVSGNDTSSLRFRYVVNVNDIDMNGIATLSPVNLNNGSIQDKAGNPATLTFSAQTYSGVIVDSALPEVINVTPPIAHTYQNGGARPALQFTISFNKPVNVTGTPRIKLIIGSNTRYVNFTSGSGSSQLIFSYSLQSADFDMDGITLDSSIIDLNGGTIKDAKNQNAGLDLGSVDTSKIFVVYPGMRSWYDFSDSSKLTFSGSNLTRINDKIGTFNLTHSLKAGISFHENGFNGGNDAYVDCTSNGAFNHSSTTTPMTLIAIFRAPVSVSNQYLFYSTNSTRPMIQFTSTSNGGTIATGVSGSQYSNSNWGTNSTTSINFWSPDQVQARAFSWSATQSRAQTICSMGGELAELITFTSKPTNSQMLELENYIRNRYGLEFP